MAVKEKITSREFPEYIREPNPDPGLDDTIKDLKPEQIEKTIMAVLGSADGEDTGDNGDVHPLRTVFRGVSVVFIER